ncbi:MAG: phosphodiester glycosidase family protein [Pseudomonadota bacterium]
MLKKAVPTFFALAFLAVAAGAIWLWATYGAYGYGVLLRRGGSYWQAMAVDDPRLSPAMRAALKQPVPKASSGPVRWRTLEPGFEAGTLPVLAGGREVDRILLARIDPSRYRFAVRNEGGAGKGIDEWEAALPQALLIVNASYYDRKGRADTPIVSDGTALGPQTYDAKAGAFVSADGTARVVDLHGRSWQSAFAGARDAMVSYPLLIGEDGASHVPSRTRWLANRSFVGQARDGRIVIGTTRDAFFSLDRLADFLIAAPLDLRVALNLDGGPIACQSIRAPGFHRKFYARWEAQVTGERVRLLRWPFANATWAMPMILMVERR